MLRDLAFRARALLRRSAVERELDDELRFHLDRQVEKHVAAGCSPEEAVRRARLELGGLSYVKQECREARGVTLLEDLIQDARYGLRKLRGSPGFTAVALLTLALGIGANTALFSVVSGVLLSPLPYRDPEELVTLHASKPPHFQTGSISWLNFRDWRADQRCLAAMALQRSQSFKLTGAGGAESIEGRLVSAELFDVLGVRPVLGRGFARGEDEVGAAPVALVSAALWRRRFGGSPDVLRETVVLDGRPTAIIGVVPAGFDVFQSGATSDVYVPIGNLGGEALGNRQWGMGFHGIGRLAPGVTIEQARADLARVTRRLAAVHPEANRGTGAAVIPFHERIVGNVRPILLTLLGAVGFVLLIACANVANLLLARATERTREVAIRVALGASRVRVVRQLLTESALLALAGGGLGLLLAVWATPAALAWLPDRALPRVGQISLDGRVLAFTLVASLLSGVLFGLAPALKATRSDLQGALKDGGRGVSGGRHRAQHALVAVQMAMVLVLLVGAGLMIRSLTRLWGADPGIDPRGAMTFGVSLPAPAGKPDPDAMRAALDRIEERLRSIPGVEAVSLSWGGLPMLVEDDRGFWLDGRPAPASTSEMNMAVSYVVGPDYLRAMGIPLRAGRFFGSQDSERGAPVVVIDEVLARQYFGVEDPVGKRIHVNELAGPAQIVGVVGHVKQWGLVDDDTSSLRAQLYSPVRQRPDRWVILTTDVGAVVRSSGAPLSFETVRAAVQELGPDYLAYGAVTMDEAVADSLGRHRFAMFLLAAFAGIGLLLAVVGIYGVVSYAVSQRTAEVGIRMALGARRGDVLGMIVGQGMKTALVGIALGVGAALALTRLMAHLLYGVRATDPLTFAAVTAGMVAVALIACYLPARRASLIEPMIALRHE